MKLQQKPIKPFNLETKLLFVQRFVRNERMTFMFPNSHERRKTAASIFEKEWVNALVRITKASGEKIFVN